MKKGKQLLKKSLERKIEKLIDENANPVVLNSVSPKVLGQWMYQEAKPRTTNKE